MAVSAGRTLTASGQDSPPASPSAARYEIEYRADVAYGKGGDVDLNLDLALPKGAAGPLAAVVLIHGGGWSGGEKESFAPFAKALAAEGLAAATISYRLAPKHIFPAQIEDCKCAVRWLRAHAEEFNVDPNRIGAMGGSAGGHLVLMLGLMDPTDGLEGEGGWKEHSSKVQAVVSFVGPTNLIGKFPDISNGILHRFLGGTYEEKPELYKQASPITYVNAGDPPPLLFQGTEDVLVPYDQAFQLTDAMQRSGVKGNVVMHVGLNHGWAGPQMDRDIRQSYDFLKEHLQAKPAEPRKAE